MKETKETKARIIEKLEESIEIFGMNLILINESQCISSNVIYLTKI